MSTSKLFTRGVLTFGLVAVLSSYGLAVERNTSTNGQSYDRSANAALPQASSMAVSEDSALKRASRVMHAKVKSPQGATLGYVYDVVLTPDLNAISYVAVSRGSVLGVGGTLHAIPWSALSEGLNGTYVAPITEQQFKQSSGFRPAYWPSSADSAWMVRGTETSRQAAEDKAAIQARRFTRIKGSTVKASAGKSAGRVHDLVIVKDTGTIAYTIVSYGGIAGLGARFAAVPQNAVTLEPALHVARIDATPAAIHANSFTPNRWPDLANPSYSRQLARAFGAEPTGTALGYVPAEGGVVAAAPSKPKPRASTRSTTPSESTMTPSAAVGEPTSADLTGTFNPSSIATMDGTVIDTGKFKATSAGPDMLWLRARTTDGRTILVNLGPRDYIGAQDFYIVRGDQIHLTGSEVAATTSGKRVFLPTSITFNNHALRLRSETGTPLWEGQTTTALGYTPAEDQAAAAGRSAVTAGPATVEFPSSGIVALGALDTSNSRTIDGTVTAVGKSAAAGQDIIWLNVKTTDGQSINVQVGPRDYVSKQGFFVVSGDRVHLTGWNANTAGAPGAAPVFVVSNISQDGHALHLRSSDGQPLWTSQSGISGQRSRGTIGRTTSRTPGEPNEPNKP